MTSKCKKSLKTAIGGLAMAIGSILPSCTDNGSANLAQNSSATQALEVISGASVTTPSRISTALDSGRCIAVQDATNGAKPTLAACADAQALTWAQPGNGQLKLGNKCLDVADGKSADGSLVQLWDCFDENTNQRWTVDNGRIIWTGHNMCLDVNDGIIGNGAALQIWTCAPGNRNQQWVLQNASTSSPAVNSASRSSCKRGVAADAGATLSLNAADLAALSPNVTWWYNWYLRAGDATVLAANDKNDMDYVQMVSVKNTDFTALANNIPPRAKYLLTFNEPNFHSQSNITPEEAAALWPNIEAFADQHNLLIVSPALNYCWSGCNENDPFVWLDKFFAACKGCRVDHIAVHAYTCDLGSLRSMSIDPFVKKYNRPIWLTEFDCADSGNIRNDVASQKAFMTEAVASLEADPNVFRYAWFMAKADGGWSHIALLDNNGRLTELGRHYVSLPQACKP